LTGAKNSNVINRAANALHDGTDLRAVDNPVLPHTDRQNWSNIRSPDRGDFTAIKY
jgi:hypothetical protein